jgi:hypothetical protein
MVSATEFFCLLGFCWLGQVIDNLIMVGITLVDYAIKNAPVFGLLYLLYWIWLIIKTVKTGNPEYILNHVLMIWQLLSQISSAILGFLRLIRP